MDDHCDTEAQHALVAYVHTLNMPKIKVTERVPPTFDVLEQAIYENYFCTIELARQRAMELWPLLDTKETTPLFFEAWDRIQGKPLRAAA